MKKTLNKMLAMLLAIVMIVGLFGTQAFAATGDNSVQIVDEGGSNPADGSLNADGVAISKTIAPTEDENFFDITLTVTTTEKIEEIYQAQDMAVVVVMDISNTMTSTFGSSTRYQAAMEAAEQFINSFAAYSNGVTVARKIGYVAFNTDAHQIFGLSDCKTTAQAAGLISSMKDKTGKIINASGYSASHSRFTNIEAGLKMGYDLLKDSGVENQYIIFLSDGFPTTYVKSGYTGYDPYDANGTRFKNNKTGLPCVFGTSYSDEAATRAQNMAATIEASGVKIFSIGVDVGGQTIAKYEEQDAKNAKSGFSVIDCYGKNTPYVIGNSVDGFKTWLKDSIGSGYYYDSTNTAGLKEAYAKIFEEIKEINMSSVENTWVVTDTMSEVQPSVIEFLHLWTKSGTNGGSALTGSAVLNGENTASYNSSAESISWDLKNSGYTITTNGNMTHYHYSLSYRIRLENEIAGFVDSKNYATNGPTSVIYQVRVNGTLSDENTLDFPIPEVEGYLGRLEFTKVSAKDSSAVAGARFTLSHHGANCAVCDGHAVIADMTAVSGADGKVVFENIPSGHTYTLTETVTPDGYLENTETYTVEVAYGVVTLDGKTPDRISNIPVTAPGSLALSAVKYLDGVAPADGQFTFVLAENGQIIQTVTNKGSSVSFDAIEYTAIGEHTYTIEEIPGGAIDIEYDGTVYTVIVEVVEKNYELVPSVKSVIGGNGNEIVFNNETIPPAKGSIRLGAVKYLDGVAPADGQFTFVLKENGQVIQTVTNNGSSVSFGAIEYTAEGTYVYTISEVAGSAVDIDYDETVYTVTVTVTRDFGTNKLVAVADKQVTEIVFNNETIPPANGSIRLGAVKYLDGVAPADGRFTFVLKENGQNVQTVTNNGSSVSFDAIEYTAEGTYVYAISEVAGSAVDIDYDETVYTVTVTVTRDSRTNKLVAVADKQVAEIVFNNETIPPTPTSIKLGAVKYLDGVAPADGQFTFVLKENGQVIQTVTNNGSSVSFGAIEYTAEGTYVYTISEVAGAAINIIYDRTVYTVVVEVSKTDNVLNASIKSISGGVDVPVFRNETIPPSAAAINLGATKLLDDKAPEGSDFTFVLKDAQGNVIESVSNDGAMVNFSTLVYDQVGTYTYTISEVEGTNWRINYDETVWTVQVQVVENGQTNELEAYVVSCTAEDGTDNGDGWPTFRNETVRILAPATIELSAIKLLDGQAPADGQFTFRLEDPYGNLLQTVTNNGSQVIFAPITYTMFGRYSYVISEVAGTDDNIIYDSARYTVVVAVKVVDDADGYRLVAEMVSIKGGPVVPVFNNITKELPPPEIPDDPPEIPDDPPEVPDEPPVEDIPDDEVPLSDVPATGDFSVVWMIACGLSAAGLVGMGIRRKKEDEDQ